MIVHSSFLLILDFDEFSSVQYFNVARSKNIPRELPMSDRICSKMVWVNGDLTLNS